MNSGYKKTITLGLEYSEFTGGITKCNQKMKELDAEFAYSKEKMEGNATESEKYAAKTSYLTDKIEIQGRKVQIARDKYEDLKKSHASTAQIEKARTALVKESTKLEKLKNDFDDARISQSNFKENATALVATVTTISTALVKCALDAASYADDMLTLSQQTGFTTDELQKLDYASELIDTDFNTITSSISKITKSMKSASSGTGDTYEAFQQLGVSVATTNGQMKDTTDVFWRTIDALKNVKNETEKDQLAMTIFGRSATELTGLIEAGSEGLKEYGNEAEELGRIISEKDLKAAGQLSDEFYKMKEAFSSAAMQLGIKFLPLLTELFAVIASIPTPVLAIIATITSTVAVIVTLAKTINSVATAGSSLAKIMSGSNATMIKTVAIVTGLVALFTALAVAIAAISGKSKEMNKTLREVGNLTSGIKSTGYNAEGTSNWKGGKTWVGEHGPEIVDVPSGSKIYNAEESKAISGNTYNITMNCDLSKMKSVNDVVAAVQGLGMSAAVGV